MYQVENIRKFLETYSDQSLAALYAHTTVMPGEDQAKKLSFFSCCCLIGARDAEHALRGYVAEFLQGKVLPPGSTHHQAIRLNNEVARDAEEEFFFLSSSDTERRERLLPLIESEMQRRSQASAIAVYSEMQEMSKRRSSMPVHKRITGGNDYVYCLDCYQEWDYRKPETEPKQCVPPIKTRAHICLTVIQNENL